MYKIYLKQAWQMLKEDKVISIISILGTALAVTMVMVVILTQKIKTANLGPEVNRERTMYITNEKEERDKGRNINVNMVSGQTYQQYLSQLKTPEAISLKNGSQGRIYTSLSDQSTQADVIYTDPVFWTIYSFSFLEGRPFSKGDFQSGIRSAVICKSLAQKLFKGEPALGKEFEYNKNQYKVCGIVKDVSMLCNGAYAQIWIPYTAIVKDFAEYHFEITILAKNENDFVKIKKEVRESEIRNNIEPDKKKTLLIGPYSRQELLIKEGNFSNEDPNMQKTFWRFYLTLAILLLIPAINLSGFSLFKIINRIPEIGIRKAFGANKKTILSQVLIENLLTSVIGGIIGLLLSYSVIIFLKDKLFAVDHDLVGENTIPLSSMISPSVFLYVFLICLIMNLLSSGIPAWRASCLRIVESIKS